jgi:O-antigen/teichoic acid export membrane protein
MAKGRGLLAHINVMFVSQVVGYGLAFALRVILAQALGDVGLGTYSLFYTSVLVAGGAMSLGVGWANVYYLNKGAYSLSTLLAASALLWAGVVAAAALGTTAYAWARGAEAFVAGKAYWLYAPAVPVLTGYLLLSSFLQGQGRFPALMMVASAQGLTAVTAAATLWVVGRLTVGRAAGAWVASFALADVLALMVLSPHRWRWAGALRMVRAALRDQVRYGLQSQLGNLAQFLNYRLDHYLVAAFAGRGAVGQYTVAVGLSESLWWISSAVVTVLAPRLSGMKKEEAADLALAASRNTLLVMGAASVGLALASPLVIRVVFGEEFLGAVRAVVILLPGTLANGVAMVVGSYLFSQGKAILNTYSILTALAVTVALDLALIPPLQVEGAALASTLAYSSGLALSLLWFGTVSGRPGWRILAPRRSDLRLYVEIWRGVWRRVLARAQTDEPWR